MVHQIDIKLGWMVGRGELGRGPEATPAFAEVSHASRTDGVPAAPSSPIGWVGTSGIHSSSLTLVPNTEECVNVIEFPPRHTQSMSLL